MVLNAYPQTTIIEGKIIDKITREPIPEVNITIASIKTSTNSEGEFILHHNLPAKITFSHIGYKKDSLLINSGSNSTIELIPLVNTLAEVVVSSKDYLANLIVQAENQIKQNLNRQHYGQGMYRHTVKIDNVSTEFQETIYNVKLNKVKILGTSVYQGRYAYKKNEWKFDSFSILEDIDIVTAEQLEEIVSDFSGELENLKSK